MIGRTALSLIGLLTLGQEIDRLVEMLRYEDAGGIVVGQYAACQGVEVIAGGGTKLFGCSLTTEDGVRVNVTAPSRGAP